MMLHIFNAINEFCPGSPLFRLRRYLLRLADVSVSGSCLVNPSVRFYGRNVSIGEETWVGPNVQFYSSSEAGIWLGHRCDIAPGVKLICGSHALGASRRRAGPGVAKDIHIGDGTWIGAGAIILGGAAIGNGSVIGAGAVVRAGNYPPNALLVGVPARIAKMYDHGMD